MQFPSLIIDAPESLLIATYAINKALKIELRRTDFCILASFALQNIIVGSKVVRVTAGIFPTDRTIYGTVLGSEGDGTFRPKAKKGHWHGHCCVLVEDTWLLDPTLDQVNKKGIKLFPIAFKLKSIDPNETTFFNVNDCDIRYNIYRIQKGFNCAPDSRKSHWISTYLMTSNLMSKQSFRTKTISFYNNFRYKNSRILDNLTLDTHKQLHQI